MEKYFSSADSRWDDICDSLEDFETHVSEFRDMLTDALDDLCDEADMLSRQLSLFDRGPAGLPYKKNGRRDSTSPNGQRCGTKSIFTCNFLPEKYMEPWEGTLDPLLPFDPQDFEVCARGSMFHLIIGKCSGGTYLCIPDWEIGTMIADPDECFWNYEHLRNAYPKLGKIDAVSIVNALTAIKHYSD